MLEWNDVLHDLRTILRDYEDQLSPEIKENLSKLAEITDTSPDMIKPSYEVVKTGIEQAVGSIPQATSGASLTTIVIVVAVVAISTGAAYVLTMAPAHLYLVNNDCPTIDMADIPFNMPGITINSNSIPPGGTTQIDISPIMLVLDSTDRSVLKLRTAQITPISMPIQLPNNISEISLNGVEILGLEYEANFEGDQNYNIVFSCS